MPWKEHPGSGERTSGDQRTAKIMLLDLLQWLPVSSQRHDKMTTSESNAHDTICWTSRSHETRSIHRRDLYADTSWPLESRPRPLKVQPQTMKSVLLKIVLGPISSDATTVKGEQTTARCNVKPSEDTRQEMNSTDGEMTSKPTDYPQSQTQFYLLVVTMFNLLKDEEVIAVMFGVSLELCRDSKSSRATSFVRFADRPHCRPFEAL